MVHRDPQTGQFVEGDGDSPEYADHEVQALGVNINQDTQGNNDKILDFNPVSERGIDSDEVAELVGMYRFGSLQLQAEQDQTDQDAVVGEMSLGINTQAEQEQLHDASERANIREAGDPGENLKIGEISDPGVLDTFQLSTVNAIGAAGTAERFLDFRGTFGTGPFVDRTDDLVIGAEASNTAGDRFKLEGSYILYWNVHEMPEGRASFARP